MNVVFVFRRIGQMPTIRERRLYADRLRQLERLGFVARYENQLHDRQPFEALVEQCAPPVECRIHDLGDEGTLYMVWLSMVAERPGVCLYDFRFVPPWPDRGFQRLSSSEDCPRNVYILPNQWQFPRADILNWRFGATGWRLPLTPVEGWLCAHSATSIPRDGYGPDIDVRIEFFGKSGRCLAETVSTLWVDRRAELTKVTQEAAKEARARFVAQKEQKWRDYLASLAPESSQKDGIRGEPESPNREP